MLLWRRVVLLLVVAGAMMGGQLLEGAGARAAETTLPPVPPPLSHARAIYFINHPDEFQSLLQRLPRRPAATQTTASPSAVPAAPPSGWNYTATTAPVSGMSNPLLMTDGTVIVHAMCTSNWYKLTPDASGSYIGGSWSQIASMPSDYAPLYFASQVLSNGKIIANGGEYNGTNCNAVWTNKGAIYDPIKNVWTAVTPPSFFTDGHIGDAQSVILANGKYMLADCCLTAQAILNTTTMAWTQTGTGKADENDEEGWALLADGTLLTTDAYVNSGQCGTNSERYTPSKGTWASAGSTVTRLSDCAAPNSSYEVGPLMTRPDGTVVGFSGVTSGVAGTAIFKTSTKTWAAGPNLPTINGANYNLADAPATILPNGNVFFAASPGLFKAPTHFFTLAPTSDSTITQVGDTTNSPSMPAYQINFLLLPTGQLLATDFSNVIGIYQPVVLGSNGNTPTVTTVPTTLTRGQTYEVQGSQFNGVAFGSYGDDQQAGTNFPLVRITNNATGHVFYAATHGFSNRSISLNVQSTADFHIPRTFGGRRIEVGASSLVVIANGVPSAAVTVTIQ